MLVEFFYALREGGLAVSTTEYLTLLEALQARLAGQSLTGFHTLARTVLVKDESHFDRFDRIFAAYFRGIQDHRDSLTRAIPDDWLERLAELDLDDEEKNRLQALGDFEQLMETLRQRLAEQDARHEGGNKWVGTAGRSPFGAYGYNPEGIRIGQQAGRHRRAVKTWERRDYADLADDRALGARNLQIALRRLRRFAREGADEELDLAATIRATAQRAGQLDLNWRPTRRNALKLIILFDIGGSMDDHVAISEQLFSAARSEFRHLHYFYFHNFIYETLWSANARRHNERIELAELSRILGPEHRLMIVGDATMSPYEISAPGGSVEHWNDEPGARWLERLRQAYPRTVWLNPVPAAHWDQVASIRMTRALMDQRMFELSPAGLDAAITALAHGGDATP